MQGDDANSWIARDTGFRFSRSCTYKHPIAVKIQTSHKPQDILDWNDEAMIHKKLASSRKTSPFVPKIYASLVGRNLEGEENATNMIVMELVIGKSLCDKLHLSESNRISLRSRLEYLNKLDAIYDNINKALIQMWKQGVVHFDLHCNNIVIVDGYDDIKIIDFGMAKISEDVRIAAKKFSDTGDAKLYWKDYLSQLKSIKSMFRFTKINIFNSNSGNTKDTSRKYKRLRHPNTLSLHMIDERYD